MTNYKVVDADTLDADIKAVADAIRAKGETTDSLAWPDGFKTAVGEISTGVDTSADTVAADKMLEGVTAHDASGTAITGTIPSKSESDVAVSGNALTAAAGYYPAAVNKQINVCYISSIDPDSSVGIDGDIYIKKG